MKTITLFKGGTGEKAVELSKVVIPDLWAIAHVPELSGYYMNSVPAKEMILDTWHLAHEFKKQLEAQSELLEACKFILSQLDPNNDHPKTQCVLYSDCLSPKETDDQSVVEYLKEVISKAESK